LRNESLQFSSRDLEVPRLLRASREQDRLMIFAQIFNCHILPDVRPGLESHPFLLHLRQAPIQDGFFQLEVGDP